MEDHALVEKILAGEDGAFKILMERHAPLLGAYLYNKTHNPADAEDLLQEVFLSVHRHLPRLKRPDRLRPWLLEIARNKVSDFYRSQAQNPGHAEKHHSQAVADSLAKVDDPSQDSSTRAEASELRELVGNAIGGLSNSYQHIVYLRLLGGMSPHEIAQQLGMNESTVRTRLLRGLKAVRKSLRGKGITPSGGRGS